MLEHYFVKPATVDRIRAGWLAPQIESYVEWMHREGYADRNIFRRVPILCHFADFARRSGATDLASAPLKVDDFASCWAVQHGTNCKTAQARRKLLSEARNPVRQMLRLALEGRVTPNRQHKSFPFEAEAPEFRAYLEEERGVRESTIHHYAHRLNCFSSYLKRLNVTSLTELSPALLASFVVDIVPKLSRTGRRVPSVSLLNSTLLSW